MQYKFLRERHIPKQGRDILQAINGHGFIAGGYARDIVLGERGNAGDIDVFSWDNDLKYDDDPTGRLLNVPHSRVIDSLLSIGYKFIFESDNAIKLRYEGKPKYPHQLCVHCIKPITNNHRDRAIQVRLYGSPEEVLSTFDFPIIKAAIWQDEIDRYDSCYDDRFIEDNRTKTLHIDHINHPVPVGMRVIKYCKKGYRISGDEYMKLFTDWAGRTGEYQQEAREAVINPTITSDNTQAWQS